MMQKECRQGTKKERFKIKSEVKSDAVQGAVESHWLENT